MGEVNDAVHVTKGHLKKKQGTDIEESVGTQLSYRLHSKDRNNVHPTSMEGIEEGREDVRTTEIHVEGEEGVRTTKIDVKRREDGRTKSTNVEEMV